MDSAKIPQSLWSWMVGTIVLAVPFVLLEFVAPDDVSKWGRIYIAGAVGGVCFELIRNRWRLEMPSGKRGLGKGPEPTFAPFGPLYDIGFLGRMLTGAVVAPAFLVVVNALDANPAQSKDLGKYLASLATRPDTLGWAALVGFAAPAVWSMAEAMVKARGAIADAHLTTIQNSVDHANKALKAQLEKTPSEARHNGEVTKLLTTVQRVTGELDAASSVIGTPHGAADADQ